MTNQETIAVCMVEDDEDIILAVQLALQYENGLSLTVEQVRRPEDLEGLADRLMAKAYQVLLIDLGLPSQYSLDQRWQAGLDLLSALEDKRCQSIPVVLTAYDDDEKRIEAARRGSPLLIAKKGADTWRTLALYIRTAYSYWQSRQSQRQLLWLANKLTHDLKNPLSVAAELMALAKTGVVALDEENLDLLSDAIHEACDDSRYLHEVLCEIASGRSCVRRANVKPHVDWRTVFGQIERRTNLFTLAYEEVTQPEFDNRFHGTLPLDAALFKRAIFNLEINALTAMREKGINKGAGRLRLEAKQAGAYLEFIVEDNAGGFNPSWLEHTPGLGFRICQEIIEDVHQGKVTCQADPTKTRFILSLPLTPQEPAGSNA